MDIKCAVMKVTLGSFQIQQGYNKRKTRQGNSKTKGIGMDM